MGNQVNSYQIIHINLSRYRGKASWYACKCGKRAEEWALIKESEKRLSKEGWSYSLNLADYTPMCKKCHREYDEHSHCRNGHEKNEQNWYETKDGSYRCRACNREKSRRSRVR